VANILLTIDVEDWFQVENFKQCIPYSSWSSCELRVEKNTHRLLDLFDSFGSTAGYGIHSKLKIHNSKLPFRLPSRPTAQLPSPPAAQQSAPTNPKVTFFVLGWLAERLPNLVREIHSRGHEVASHGFHHELCSKQSRGDLKQDLIDSKKLLEDIIGDPVYGYRAPSFSINDDILKLVEECGYRYDSSYNSFGFHGRYGKLSLSSNGTRGIAIDVSQPRLSDIHGLQSDGCDSFKTGNSKMPFDSCLERSGPQGRSPVLTPIAAEGFYELPISNLELKTQNSKLKIIFPWGGGGYFRLIPFPLFKRGVKSILKKNGAYIFYMHPWEIDPNQPKVAAANRSYRFRHYVNLDKTFSRLERIVHGFDSCRFITCSEYLKVQQAPSFKIQNS